MQLANRVDATATTSPPFNRFRLAAVLTETGAQLDVNYAPTDCATGAPAQAEASRPSAATR